MPKRRQRNRNQKKGYGSRVPPTIIHIELWCAEPTGEQRLLAKPITPLKVDLHVSVDLTAAPELRACSNLDYVGDTESLPLYFEQNAFRGLPEEDRLRCPTCMERSFEGDADEPLGEDVLVFFRGHWLSRTKDNISYPIWKYLVETSESEKNLYKLPMLDHEPQTLAVAFEEMKIPEQAQQAEASTIDVKSKIRLIHYGSLIFVQHYLKKSCRLDANVHTRFSLDEKVNDITLFQNNNLWTEFVESKYTPWRVLDRVADIILDSLPSSLTVNYLLLQGDLLFEIKDILQKKGNTQARSEFRQWSKTKPLDDQEDQSKIIATERILFLYSGQHRNAQKDDPKTAGLLCLDINTNTLYHFDFEGNSDKLRSRTYHYFQGFIEFLKHNAYPGLKDYYLENAYYWKYRRIELADESQCGWKSLFYLVVCLCRLRPQGVSCDLRPSTKQRGDSWLLEILRRDTLLRKEGISLFE